MVLELSMSLLLNPNDFGFFIGSIELEANAATPGAKSYLLKLWVVMFQVTLYGQE